MASASAFASSASATTLNIDPSHLKHKRRFCRHEGCNRIVKSQGLCQRHGAKPRKCKVEGCDKQAQGNFDKMCKSHFKAMKRATTPLPRVPQGSLPPPPQGFSVYDNILPASISYVPRKGSVMPLIAHLKAGFDGLKPPAWHRNEERRARGMHPIDNPATQLEGWERELVWMEILVLTGAPGASFRHLARAWGRDKGFHMVLAQFICERQGDVQRKKRIAERESQEATSAGDKSRGPAKKRRRLKRNPNLSADVSADIWDDSAYGDVITNEALAADIFDFSPQEFESATALRRWKQVEENSDTASVASQRSVASQAAASTSVATSHGATIVPKPPAIKMRSTSKMEHPEQNPETSALVLGSADSVSHPGQMAQFAALGVTPDQNLQRLHKLEHYDHDSEVIAEQRHREQMNQSHMSPGVDIHSHSQHTNQQFHPDITMPMPHQQHRDDHPAQLIPMEQMHPDQSRHQQYHHDAGAHTEQYQQQPQGNQGHYNDVDALHQPPQFVQTVGHHPLRESQYHGDSHVEQQQLNYQGEIHQPLPSQYHQHQGHYQNVASTHVEKQDPSHYPDVAAPRMETQHQRHFQDVAVQHVETQHQRNYQDVGAPHVEAQHQRHYQDIPATHIEPHRQMHFQDVATPHVETQHQRHYQDVTVPHVETQHQRNYQEVAAHAETQQLQRHYQDLAQHLENQSPGQTQHYQLQGVDVTGVNSGMSNQGHQYPPTQAHQGFAAPAPAQYNVNVATHTLYQSVLPDQGFHHQQHEQHQHYVQQQHTMHSQNQNVSPGHDVHAFHRMREHPEQNPETSALPPDLTHPPKHQQYQPGREIQGDDEYNL